MTYEQYQATPKHVLEHQIMSPGEGKNEREWWACHEIEKLRARIAVLEAALNNLMIYGCPACNGDCSSANPPVIGCPMEAAHAALGERE